MVAPEDRQCIAERRHRWRHTVLEHRNSIEMLYSMRAVAKLTKFIIISALYQVKHSGSIILESTITTVCSQFLPFISIHRYSYIDTHLSASLYLDHPCCRTVLFRTSFIPARAYSLTLLWERCRSKSHSSTRTEPLLVHAGPWNPCPNLWTGAQNGTVHRCYHWNPVSIPFYIIYPSFHHAICTMQEFQAILDQRCF